jgi:hypothetical protein
VFEDKRPPIIGLNRVTLDWPAPAAVWRAPDAQSWAREYGKAKQDPPGYWPRLLNSLMTTGKLDRELDLFQVSTSLNWLWLHYRNRVSTRFDDDPSSRTVDTDFARALHHFHPYFGSQRHEHPPHSGEALLWHLTNMWTATNFEMIEAAAGRRGRPAAEEALTYLRQHWVGTAAARRTVAHAAQIFAAASRDPACSERSGPFVLYHVGPEARVPSLLTSVQIFGPFHCGLVLSLYTLLQSHHSHDILSTAPVCRLTDIIDWEKVGLAGMGPASSDPSYTVSRWIMEGACGFQAAMPV